MMCQNLQQKKVSTLNAKKNVLVLFLSPRGRNETTLHYKVCDHDGKQMVIDGKETNDPYVKLLLDELNKQKQSLDNIYLLCSESVGHGAGDQNFKEMVHAYCDEKSYKRPSIDSIPYNESQKDSKTAAFESVLRLSEAFQQDTVDVSAENITVYMDFAGGMRDTALLMTAILRLFAFQDIEVKQIMYAHFDGKKIEGSDGKKYPDPNGNHHLSDLTEIYHLYDLIAGAEEFTSFGSVENLQNYYKNRHLSPELKNLLDAMEAFSSDLKLCAFGRFDQTIKKLKTAIDDFSVKPDKTEDDKVFDILIKRIEKEYSSLLKSDTDLIDYMGWCLNNGYTQQALTIVSENLPDYLVAKKILVPEGIYKENGEINEENQWYRKSIEANEKNGTSDWRSWTDPFVSNYLNWCSAKQLRREPVICEIDEKTIKTIINIRKEIRDWRNALNHSNVVIVGGNRENVKERKMNRLRDIREVTKDWRDIERDSMRVEMGYELSYQDIVEQLKEWYRYFNSVLKKGERNVY